MGVGWFDPKLQQGSFEPVCSGLVVVVATLDPKTVVFAEFGKGEIVVGLTPPSPMALLAQLAEARQTTVD